MLRYRAVSLQAKMNSNRSGRSRKTCHFTLKHQIVTVILICGCWPPGLLRGWGRRVLAGRGHRGYLGAGKLRDLYASEEISPFFPSRRSTVDCGCLGAKWEWGRLRSPSCCLYLLCNTYLVNVCAQKARNIIFYTGVPLISCNLTSYNILFLSKDEATRGHIKKEIKTAHGWYSYKKHREKEFLWPWLD